MHFELINALVFLKEMFTQLVYNFVLNFVLLVFREALRYS